jgi:hypothetical protein
MIEQCLQELYDTLKPYDPSIMSCIDTAVYSKAIQEYRRLIEIQGGNEVEYDGREYVEDESIMGSCDKQVFYAKEMVSDLTGKPKNNLDPFMMAKLDVQTINGFVFPKLDKSFNKY